jgi:hypothetical protein
MPQSGRSTIRNRSPPPGNRIASLSSTSAADFPHPANPPLAISRLHPIPGRADDSAPAQLVALCWNCDSAKSPASASIQEQASARRRRDERAPGALARALSEELAELVRGDQMAPKFLALSRLLGTEACPALTVRGRASLRSEDRPRGSRAAHRSLRAGRSAPAARQSARAGTGPRCRTPSPSRRSAAGEGSRAC